MKHPAGEEGKMSNDFELNFMDKFRGLCFDIKSIVVKQEKIFDAINELIEILKRNEEDSK